MRKRLALLFLFCASFLLAAVAPAGARGSFQSLPQIGVTATAGYGDTGAYVIGEWVPVRVTLDNPQGGQSMRVTVRVIVGYSQGVQGAVYDRAIDLPSPSRKEVTLYTYDGGYTRNFVVKVLDGTREVASLDVSAEPYEPPATLIVGVASSDTSLLNILKGEDAGHIVEPLPPSYGYSGLNPIPNNGNGVAAIAHITLADIPTLSQALDSLGAIVLDDVDTGTLSAEQRAALEAWVARGGTLIATYRPGGLDTLAGLGDLSPVIVSGSRDVSSHSSLGDLASVPIAPTGSIAVGNAQLKAGPQYSSRVLASADGTPLLVVRDLGLGRVVYLGLSPALPPLKGWEGTLPLAKRILSEHDLRLSYGASLRTNAEYSYMGFPGAGSIFETYGSIFALPGLELPDPWLIGGFLLFYIIIIGPINFIVLRRMRRAELAWITIPVLVVLFSVVAYSLALGSKGASLISINANVVHTVDGTEQASLSQHFGLYSPARRTYSFDLNTDSVLTEINPYGYYRGSASGNTSSIIGGNGSTSITGINIDTWSLRGFLAQHTARLQSPLATDLRLGQNEIVGIVTNRTNGPLEDVALVRGRAWQYIGLMAPGETVDVHLDISTAIFDNSTPAKILPPPPGVNAPQAGGYYYGSNNSRNNQPQRLYDRKVELLSAALYPFVSGEPPTDMSVVTLAWGPAPTTRFDVPGYDTSPEDVNVWAGLVQVKGDGNGEARLDSGSVPYTMYAPANDPSILPMGKVYLSAGFAQLSSSTMVLYPPFSLPPGAGPVPTPAPFLPPLPPQLGPSSQSPVPSAIAISPQAELQYRLPAGTKPSMLTFKYNLKDVDEGGTLDLLAYNVDTGRWDKVASLARGNPLTGVPLPNPAQYTGSGGQVILRLLSPTGPTTVEGNFYLALNSNI